jgi:aldose 1-epimerase
MNSRFHRHSSLPLAYIVALALPHYGCGAEGNRSLETRQRDETMASVTSGQFGQLPDGTPVEMYTLTNANGMELKAITYGGIITSLRVPDRNGEFDDIVLGYDDLAGYLEENPYFGAIIGRYGNRIAGGRFSLDEHDYALATNNGPNHLHGGNAGFDKVPWQAEPFEQGDSVGLVFSYSSPDGEEGYPGNLEARVTYTLTGDNELVFDYYAVTDRPTPVNLTQHSYFNLAGHASGDILGQELMINADNFTPVDSTLIPTGEIAHVAGTPFDFRSATAIGASIDQDADQLRYGSGYDHNFVLNRSDSAFTHAALVYDPQTGRSMDIYTTEPGIQFYSGNFLDGSITGKGGHAYQHRSGFCLETQHFPDSPNKPEFPSTILRPGEEYRSTTTYVFSVRP